MRRRPQNPVYETMELLIVRHAIAFERDDHRWRDDGARPLSPAGMRRARKAAAGLKVFSKAPERLLTSPLVRAKQTAQILTDVAGWPEAEEASELSPGAPALAVLTLLGKDRSKLVAVVGHQPGLGALLTACLLGEDRTLPIEFKKNAVACVSFEGRPRAGRGALEWLATPRMLRGIRRS
jgi:phosphohistidine phosphatase